MKKYLVPSTTLRTGFAAAIAPRRVPTRTATRPIFTISKAYQQTGTISLRWQMARDPIILSGAPCGFLTASQCPCLARPASFSVLVPG